MTPERTVKEEIEIFRFQGKDAGPSFTIFGAVHGNEKCGPRALRKILSLIESGKIEITAGQLTIVPICNPRAYEQHVRFTEHNLNRSLYPRIEKEMEFYEHRLGNVLCPILDETDYLLDLHSCTAPSDPFMILGEGIEENKDFAEGLGVPSKVHGWHNAVQASTMPEDNRHSQGTTEYVRVQGGVGITVECGNHDHPRGADFAFQAALNGLKFLNIATIDPSLFLTDVFQEKPISIGIKQCPFKRMEGNFLDNWVNLQPVPAGTDIAEYADGEILTTDDRDGYLIMPNKNADIGVEWYFWGIEEDI